MYNHHGPFLLSWISLNPAWISNCIHHNVWNEITHPFPNFKSTIVEVWEWISDFILHFPMRAITCWDLG